MSGNTSPLVEGGRLRPPAPAGAEQIEYVRRQVDRLCWSGILLGLAFTMTNVQGFAASGARPWSMPWFAAWLLDPMVSLVLLAILRAEQLIGRYGVRGGGWVRGAKWFTLAATYVMNTWAAFAAGSAALVVLHSVPPSVVFVAAEAVTDLRDKFSEIAARAFMNGRPVVPDEASQVSGQSSRKRPERRPSSTQKRRTSFAEYLDRARAARRSDVAVTPAWVREVTGCSRGLSSRLAAELNEREVSS